MQWMQKLKITKNKFSLKPPVTLLFILSVEFAQVQEPKLYRLYWEKKIDVLINYLQN